MNYQAAIPRFPSTLLGAIAVFWAIASSGCTNLQPLADATKSFDLSVKAGTEAMGDLYRGLNDAEVDLYYLMIELDPECELGDRLTIFSPDDDSTSLCKRPKDPQAESEVIDNPSVTPPFSVAGLNRRMQLLGVMSRYSATLAMAASAKTPAEYQEEITGLAGDLESLEVAIRALDSNPKSTGKDKSFSASVLAPLSSLVGVVGRWVLERKQAKAVRRAVEGGRQPFETIASFLVKDLKDIYLPVATTGAEDRAATLSLFYAANRKTMTLAERTEAISRVRQAEVASAAIKTAQPESIPAGLLDAHASLVKAVLEPADGKVKAADLEEVQASLDRLLANLAVVVDSVRKLKEL